MDNITLFIVATGSGKRFGEGIKHLEPVGPNGEIIMDYSIHDALEFGCNKVVFIIHKDFKEIIGKQVEKIIPVGMPTSLWICICNARSEARILRGKP